MQNFLSKNKVILSAILSALLLVFQQAMSTSVTNWIPILYAAGIAVLGVIANNWKGGGITVTGIIGTVAYALTSTYDTGHFTWKQFAISAAMALISALVSSLKAYDTTPATAPFTSVK